MVLEPFEKVDARKRANLVAAARSYLAQHRSEDEVQFDVVSVVFGEPETTIEYLPEAFYPIMNRR